MISRPDATSPIFNNTLITSVDCKQAITPGKIPKTPPSAQDGTNPGGGGFDIDIYNSDHSYN